MKIRLSLLLSLSALVACSGSKSHTDAGVQDAGVQDASVVLDSGTEDASVPDDAGFDAGSPDFGTINTCTTDCPDLVIDSSLLTTSVVIETREFSDPAHFDQDMPHTGSDCSVAEGSVGAAGVRRLLRFSTGVTNIGAGDLLLGSPSDPKNTHFFVYAPCHGHYHFIGFANYRLLNTDGSIALDGHKQAFCIEDNIDKLGVEPNPSPPTNCDSPGLHRGWSDVYTNHTEANWIDITGLAAGTYTLVVTLNDQHVIVESDYTNNAAQVQVTITDNTNPEICPSDTEALLRCPMSMSTTITRCYSGRRDTETCKTGTTCTQPDEIAHQAHCGVGGTGSLATTCPSDVSSTPFCTQVADPMTGAMKSVREVCNAGVTTIEYCGTMCVVGSAGAVCQ
ncbi:MAG: lysyl oxidase family protein [Polyangia bacterium]